MIILTNRYLRSMMWKYDSPSFRDQMARDSGCREYKLIVFYAWKLSPSFTYYYSEEKYFDSNDAFENWLLDEYEDLFQEVICDNCEERIPASRLYNEGYD